MFPWLVYLTNICHLWMLAILYEQSTSTNIGHLSATSEWLQWDKSQLNLIETCRVPMTCLCLTVRWVSCEWTVSFIILSGWVFRLWEHYNWQVCLNVYVWPNQEGVGRVWQVIHGAACAVHSYWNVCQGHNLRECGFTLRCVWMVAKRVVSHYVLTEGFFFGMLFSWVIPQRVNFICQRFGILCLFHLPRQVWKWNRQCSKALAYKFIRQEITQKKAYNVQNTLKVWTQERVFFLCVFNWICR